MFKEWCVRGLYPLGSESHLFFMSWAMFSISWTPKDNKWKAKQPPLSSLSPLTIIDIIQKRIATMTNYVRVTRYLWRFAHGCSSVNCFAARYSRFQRSFFFAPTSRCKPFLLPANCRLYVHIFVRVTDCLTAKQSEPDPSQGFSNLLSPSVMHRREENFHSGLSATNNVTSGFSEPWPLHQFKLLRARSSYENDA